MSMWPWLFFVIGWAGGIVLATRETRKGRWITCGITGVVYIVAWICYRYGQ